MIDAIKLIWQFIKEYAAVIILAILLILFVFYIVTPFAKVEDDALVIAFIGVLATFIVIGNFAQTTAIKTDIESKMTQMSTQIGKVTTTANDNQQKIASITTDTDTNKKDISKLRESINSLAINDTITHSDIAQFFALFTGETRDVQKIMRLLGKMTNEESIYYISMVDGTSNMAQFALNENNEPILVKQDGSPIEIEDISKISGVQFEWSQIKYAYKLLRYIPYADIQDEGQTMSPQEQISTENEDQIEKQK